MQGYQLPACDGLYHIIERTLQMIPWILQKCGLHNNNTITIILISTSHRVTDFVLVWEVKSRKKRRSKSKSHAETAVDEEEAAQEESRSEKRKAQLARWRDKFIQNLQSASLLLEKVPVCFSPVFLIHFLI